MTSLTALRSGFRQAWRYRRSILVMYLATLLLAGLAAWPLHALLQAEVGHSAWVQAMVKGFDYTFLNDFWQNYGAGFIPVFNQSVVLVGAYFLLLVFLTGGLASLLVQQPATFDRAVFWGGSATYFWRMLRLTLFFLGVHALVLALFGGLYYQVTKGLSPMALDNEGIITACLRWLVPLYLLVAALVFMVQDYAKLMLIQGEYRWIWPAVKKAFSFNRRHFRQTYGLYLLNMGLLGLLLGGNYYLSTAFQVTTTPTILLSFVLSQLFVLARYGLKVINLGSAVVLVEKWTNSGD
ncbi:MAG: hypothetical protein DA408_20765 [Bacteroidetes bacterium]|nr:MAG: hypothetical protein C7N36_18920 [Bacteroidota bacterium]PTM08320.1 MAG: hypothetical protein DA408_20765 [Bacteroidota bacterium]